MSSSLNHIVADLIEAVQLCCERWELNRLLGAISDKHVLWCPQALKSVTNYVPRVDRRVLCVTDDGDLHGLLMRVARVEGAEALLGQIVGLLALQVHGDLQSRVGLGTLHVLY